MKKKKGSIPGVWPFVIRLSLSALKLCRTPSKVASRQKKTPATQNSTLVLRNKALHASTPLKFPVLRKRKRENQVQLA